VLQRKYFFLFAPELQRQKTAPEAPEDKHINIIALYELQKPTEATKALL
jgi:hypothetical protein